MRNSMDNIVIDTNIMLYAIDPTSKFFKASHSIIQKGISNELQLCIVDKSLYEFYRVLSSKSFIKKLGKAKVIEWYNFYLLNSCFKKITSSKETLHTVAHLLQEQEIAGKHIFDIVLVACMIENEVKTLYTKNVKDFSKIPYIQVIDPTL